MTRRGRWFRRDPAPGSFAELPAEAQEGARRELQTADQADRGIVEAALPFTMTGIPRLLAVVDSVRYCARREISGAFVECGVWRGGSVMAMLLTLLDMGVDDRDVYLYDTFEGMTEPTEHDTSRFGESAVDSWRTAEQQQDRVHGALFNPELFNEEAVRKTLIGTGYPAGRLHFVRGPVEQTIPQTIPASLALLRLDTDWYESTRHELHHLYPVLSPGGVLIIDDYGHWEGCRRAVDEYFAAEPAPLLSRIDYAGRIGVKH